jgi:hypothetical protein
VSKQSAKVWAQRRTIKRRSTRFFMTVMAHYDALGSGMLEKFRKYLYSPLPRGTK